MPGNKNNFQRLMPAALVELLEQRRDTSETYIQARAAGIRSAMEQSVNETAATPLVLGLFALLLLDVASVSAVAAWYLVMIALAGHRFWVAKRSTKALDIHADGRAMAGNLILSGLWFSFSGIFLIPADNLIYQAIMMAWLAGVSSALLLTYAMLPRGSLSFLYSGVLPVTLYFLYIGDPTHLALGAACLAYVAVQSSVAIRTSIQLTRGMISSAHNEQLIVELEKEKAYVSELNTLLQADIMEREKASSDLRMAKEQAEELAEQLMLLSSLDGLTSIANRRSFDESMRKEWNRCARDGRPLSLIICDIDYFKPYNDRYGHPAGDDCLVRVAAVLEALTRRSGDIAARYGGEEFVLLLPGAELDAAVSLAERARSEIEALRIEHESSAIHDYITASFGVSSLIPQQDLRPGALVRAADQALYRAKHEGRNRCVAVRPFEDGDDHSIGARSSA